MKRKHFDCLSYAQFMPNAVIDGRNRDVRFILVNPSVITVTIPHFWEFAGFNLILFSLLLLILLFKNNRI